MSVVFNPVTGTFVFTGSSGGGGGSIGGTIVDTQVAFGTGADTIGGSNLLTWLGTELAIDFPTTGFLNRDGLIEMVSTITDATLDTMRALRVDWTYDPSVDVSSGGRGYVEGFNVGITTNSGGVDLAQPSFRGAAYSFDIGNNTNAHGNYYTVGTETFIGNRVTATQYLAGHTINVGQYFGGSAPTVYGYWATLFNLAASPLVATPTMYAFFADAMGGKAANPYSFWSDEDGVYRIKADNTFDSVYQAIPALYNPQVTKYTPGAANYERIVEYWTGNVATFGTEAGGTGTQRALNLVGSVIEANGVPITTATSTFVSALMLMGG